jgi:monothiol glutaredoxin
MVLSRKQITTEQVRPLPCMQILKQMEVPFETVDVLTNEMLRSGLKEYSQWPTFPQVYIGGEFYGGCDIMLGVLTVTCFHVS